MTDYDDREDGARSFTEIEVETILIDPQDPLPLFAGEEVPPQPERHVRGTIVALHGFNPFPWDHPQGKFMAAVNQLRHDWVPRGYNVVSPVYDSLRPFPECAGFVALQLKQAGIRHNVHFVGYSMGGLVARVAALDTAFQTTSVTTICTPHHGTAPWVPGQLHSDGSRSMAPGCKELNWLNNLTRDQARRHQIRSMGVHYTEKNGAEHPDDQLILMTSQMGHGLGFRNGVTFRFYERRSRDFGIIHSECQHFPMMQYFMPRIAEHIEGMEHVMKIG